MKAPVILLVEDEAPIRDMLRFALEPAGFKVLAAENARMAKQYIEVSVPDLILVDWMLPGISGIEFIKQLKQKPHTQDIPTILLTARAEESNKILGFETGADDYVTKPFSTRELIARIRTILKRGPLISPVGLLKVQDLLIDTNTHQVKINEQLLDLTPNEYKLLLFFCKNPNKVYSRAQLLAQVWEDAEAIDERTVDVQIRRLRDRLKPFGYETFLQTVRGFGYQWQLSKS